MKMLLSVAILMMYPLCSMSSNISTESSTILFIDKASSVLTYNPPYSFWSGEEQEEKVSVSFGGTVQIFQTDYYIDTKYDGTPIPYPSSHRKISINFPTLDLPEEVSSFDLTYNIGPFAVNGINISYEWNFCVLEAAMGNMCSSTILRTGVSENLTGIFDGTNLNVDGHLEHAQFGEFYSFHIEASSPVPSPVPLSRALTLFASGLIIAFGSLRLNNQT